MKPLILAFAAALLALPAQAQKSADNLRVSWRDAVPNVDPYYNTQRNGIVLADLAWDGLLYRDPDTNIIGPALATAWRQVDETTLEFTLRDGVTFHNGDPFTADDVVYTFNALPTDKRVASPSNYAFLAGAEKIDALHVRVKLKKPFPPAINVIAAVMPIWPAAYRERIGADAFAKAPVGTGPYRILPITGPGEIALERFDAHYAGSPKPHPAIRRLTIHQVTDTATEMAELLGNRADWISDFPGDQFDNISKIPTLQAVRAEVQRVTYLNMDASGRSGADLPLTKLKVRQAVAHAIDRKTLAAQFMPGGSQVLDIACFRTEFGCDQKAGVHYDYNPALARQLLAEAGYPNGVEIEIHTYLPSIWIGAIQNQLKEVGITANTRVMQAGAVIQLAMAGKLQSAMAGWGGFAVNDVSALLGYFYTGSPYDMSHDPEVAALVTKAANLPDPDQRRALYAQAFHLVSDRAYMLPLFTYVKTYAFSKQLDFTPFYDDNPRFYRARWKN